MLQKINLPYSLNALEPFYSRETLDIHYNTLYTAYIDNTNKTEEKLKLASRMINANSNGRGKISEILVTNYNT